MDCATLPLPTVCRADCCWLLLMCAIQWSPGPNCVENIGKPQACSAQLGSSCSWEPRHFPFQRGSSYIVFWRRVTYHHLSAIGIREKKTWLGLTCQTKKSYYGLVGHCQLLEVAQVSLVLSADLLGVHISRYGFGMLWILFLSSHVLFWIDIRCNVCVCVPLSIFCMLVRIDSPLAGTGICSPLHFCICHVLGLFPPPFRMVKWFYNTQSLAATTHQVSARRLGHGSIPELVERKLTGAPQNVSREVYGLHAQTLLTVDNVISSHPPFI